MFSNDSLQLLKSISICFLFPKNCMSLGPRPSFCLACWWTCAISESCGRTRLSTSSRNVFSSLRWPFHPIGEQEDEQEDKWWRTSARHRGGYTWGWLSAVWMHAPRGICQHTGVCECVCTPVDAQHTAHKRHLPPRILTLPPEAQAPLGSGDLAVPVGVTGVEEGPDADLVLV